MNRLLPTLDIELWIAQVSSHPHPLPAPMADAILVGSDEEDRPADSTPVARTVLGAKRRRADTASSPTSRHTSDAIPRKASRALTGSSRASTPPPSEPDASSIAPSDVDSTVTRTTRQSKTTSDETSERERRKSTKYKRQNAKDQLKELEAEALRCRSSPAPYYKSYKDPILEPTATGKRATHYLFECLRCGRLVWRQIGGSDSGNLKNHINLCPGPQSATLDGFGVTGGSLKLGKEDVRETSVLWVATCVRPFSIIHDPPLQRLFSTEAKEFRPHRVTLSKDLKRMYTATQDLIRADLAAHRGVFHIGLDLCQSSNGHDFLGVVIFRAITHPEKTMIVGRFVLECLHYTTQHTGVQLAKAMHSIFRKFKIENRVWGIVCDNASNNEVMMQKLGTLKLERMNGPPARVHCFLHILNLVAQDILKPFRQKQRQLAAANRQAGRGDESEEEEEELLDDLVETEDEDVDPEDDGAEGTYMMDSQTDDEENATTDGDGKDSDEEDDSALLPKMLPGSADERQFLNSTGILWKSSKFAHKLRYTPRARREFKEYCAEREVDRPHNVRRNVKTRWNGTGEQLGDVDRTFDAIIPYQRDNRIARSWRFVEEDRPVIRQFIDLLQPLRQVTEICSKSEVPLLCDVLPHYDGLHYEYTKIRNNNKRPLYARHAADRAIKKFNKYYTASDTSVMYRLALLCHPSFRVEYLQFAEWETEWIEAAVALAEKYYEDHYKPRAADLGASQAAASKRSQFGYSSYLEKMYAALDGPKEPMDLPVKKFVYAPRVMDTTNGSMSLYNPLVWWQGQCVMGNEWDGLTQMALDVLSTPATSVDVERAFSFVSHMVSKRRHKLSPLTIQAATSLGSYAKAGLIKSGCLAKALAQEQAAKKATKARGSKQTTAGK